MLPLPILSAHVYLELERRGNTQTQKGRKKNRHIHKQIFIQVHKCIRTQKAQRQVCAPAPQNLFYLTLH